MFVASRLTLQLTGIADGVGELLSVSFGSGVVDGAGNVAVATAQTLTFAGEK